MIIAGNGVRVGQACDALFALARALDAPVATTAAGKGVFPEVDPLGAGVMGTFGDARGQRRGRAGRRGARRRDQAGPHRHRRREHAP